MASDSVRRGPRVTAGGFRSDGPKISAMLRMTGYCCACPERVQDLPHARVPSRRAASIA
jgi:hypothetical protein